MGKIVLEDFNGGEGFYKVHLDYLNKKQVEEIEVLVSKWKPTDEDIKSCIAMCLTDANEQRFKDYDITLKDCLAYLEKQGKSKFKQCIQEGDKIVTNKDGTHFNVSQLERVSQKVTDTKETAKEFLKSAEIMDENGKLADEYRLEKQGEKKEINLVEILKHYPRETELYSPLYGKLWLAEVDEEDEIITCYTHHLDEGCTRGLLEQENLVCFYSNGTTGLPDFTISKDCMLFLYDTEKQSGQKSVDKVEPKFKVGDWIISNDVHEDYRICKIIGIEEEKYSIESIYGYKFYDDFEDFDKKYHLWSLKDAKDGDVLVGSKEWNIILMFRGIGNTEWDDVIDYHCYYDYRRKEFVVQKDLEYWGNTENNQLKPATKEQREQLFQKIKEAGYEWDAEKKKLRKVEQKPTWSDENKKIIDGIIEYLECFNDYDCGDEPYEEYYERFEKYIKFMESLKPQSQWKPSDEHIEYLQAVVDDIHNIGSESCCIALRDLLEQLKSL